ncbi:hypothetical protein BG003_011811 [Podila horticola]|nr:hypothetical protein BG003_011811 [Podila horticola]
MAITQTSPGDIPLIVHIIGCFLPPEERWLATNIRVRHPKTLIDCIKVNRLWRRTLTPLLWIEFNAEYAFQMGIPPSIIQAKSPHFRYARLNSDFPTLVLYATCLRALNVDFKEPMAIRDLTRSNPELGTLSISLKHEFVLLSLKPILEPLKQLRVLHLRQCRVATLDQIVEPLNCLSTLQSLELSSFSRLERTDAPLPQLGSVANLVLGCSWARNPGQVQIVRCCPNLQSLKVKVEREDRNSFPSAALSTNLRECCPKLTSLQHHSGMLGIPMEYNQYQIQHHEDLLNAAEHLEDYQFPLERFCTRFCDQLLVHAPSLKTIKVACDSASASCWQNVGRLLSCCPNLVSVQLSFRHPTAKPETCLALFEEPWICWNLEQLDLGSLYPRGLDGLEERVSKLLYMQWDLEEAHGRLMSVEDLANCGAKVEKSSDRSDSSSSGTEGSNEGSSDESDGSDGSESSSDENELSSQTTNAHHRSQRPTSYWTRILASHPQPDRNFYQKIAKEGWTTSFSLDHVEQKTSRLEKIVWDRVFEQVLAWPKMRRLNLGRAQFVKKGHVMNQ